MSNQQLTVEAMALPLSERVSLAQELWRSIDGGWRETDGPSLLWEAIGRDQELSAGTVIGRTHEQVMATARRAIGCS
jgi:hypothetical protein